MALSTVAACLPDLTYDNISLHTIPWAWLISIAAPRLWGRYLYYKSTNRDMDVVHPRRYAKSVAKDTTIDEKTRGQILRCEAAMNNGLENIAIFCAAVRKMTNKLIPLFGSEANPFYQSRSGGSWQRSRARYAPLEYHVPGISGKPRCVQCNLRLARHACQGCAASRCVFRW